MKRHRQPTSALAEYVAALVAIGGQLTTILHHMWEHESPDAARDPAETLAHLIADVMPPRYALREVDLRVAARLLNATAEAIEENLFLVPDDGPPEGPEMNGTERLH